MILPVYRTSVRQVVVFRVIEAQYSSKHVCIIIACKSVAKHQSKNLKKKQPRTKQGVVSFIFRISLKMRNLS